MQVSQMTPISKLYLLSGVPLDSTYTDGLDFFNNKTEQANYFMGKQVAHFTDLTPVKLFNQVRLPVCADNIYNCNYLMFQNANFSDRWIYAFITKIDYINLNMCLVSFSIDVLQTWYFDYTVNQSMIEREHVEDDTIGLHIIPENLEHGEYVLSDVVQSGHNTPYKIVMACTFDSSFQDASGEFYTQVYSGLHYNYFDDATSAGDFILEATRQNKQDGIVAVFQMPSDFVSNPDQPQKIYTVTVEKAYSNIDGYAPKNNKLFTYPYNFLYVTNYEGIASEFPYENFSDSKCNFRNSMDMSANPTQLLTPLNYKGVSINYNEKMSVSGYPLCAYSTDAFVAWLAQEKGSLIASGVTSITSAIASPLQGAVSGGMQGGAVGAASGAAFGVASGMVSIFNQAMTLLGQSYDYATKPPQAHGAQGACVNIAETIKGFALGNMHIKRQFAEVIDGYFTRFGYKVMRLGVPNTKSRPSFNYIKLVDSNITGRIPFEDINKIKAIYNNGITFWHGDWVGHYERNNK